MIEEEVINLSKKLHFNSVKAIPLKKEASGREYWRIFNELENTVVLCYLDPAIGNHSNFVNISKELINNSIFGVNVIYHDSEVGITLQEDLGDHDLISIFNLSNKNELLKKSLKLLAELQESKINNLEKFSKDELINQMALFQDIFCKKFLKIKSDNSINDLISVTIDMLYEHPWVNCHFDFERRNLFLNTNKEIIIIDYQDMKKGPIGIDLAGILVDHYYDVDLSEIEKLLSFYSMHTISKYSKKELFEFLRWGCIQRNLRILGTLSNLYLTEKRSFRLKDLPLILKNLISMIPKDHLSKKFIESEVEPLLVKRIEHI